MGTTRAAACGVTTVRAVGHADKVFAGGSQSVTVRGPLMGYIAGLEDVSFVEVCSTLEGKSRERTEVVFVSDARAFLRSNKKMRPKHEIDSDANARKDPD